MLDRRDGKTTLLWIPGYHSIVCNAGADACAKQAAAITDGAPQSVFFATASALIHRKLVAYPDYPSNCRIKAVYTQTFSWPANCQAASARSNHYQLNSRHVKNGWLTSNRPWDDSDLLGFRLRDESDGEDD